MKLFHETEHPRCMKPDPFRDCNTACNRITEVWRTTEGFLGVAESGHGPVDIGPVSFAWLGRETAVYFRAETGKCSPTYEARDIRGSAIEQHYARA
jgi:hypothetical protein